MKVIFNSSKEEEKSVSTKKETEFNDPGSAKKLRKIYQEFRYLDALLEIEVRNHFELKTNE